MKTAKNLALIAITVVLLTVCFIFGASALEPTGQCGENVYWNYNSATGELVISGEGEVYNDDEIVNGSYFDTPFKNCNDILTVIIEDNITSIGSYMFYNCTNLSEVNIGGSVSIIFDSAFANCTSLESITIPSNVTEIKNNTFYRCTSLSELNLSEGLKTIGEAAFKYCGNIKELIVPDSVIKLGNYAFEDSHIESLIIGNGTIDIPYMAFGYCNSLKNIVFGDNLETISSTAFYCCHNLITVEIKDSLKTIGSSAFSDCNNIRNIYYSGTKEHWQSIEVSSYNSYLLSADIHYNNEDIHTSEITSEATCYYEGQEKITCSHGNSYYKAIPQKEHLEEFIPEISATCITEGYTEGKICTLCGNVLEGHHYIPTTDHSWDNGTETIKADCFNDGEIVYKCLTCGELKKEKVNRYEHIFSSDYTIDIEATCYREGEQSKHCLREGCTAKIDTVKIPMVDHELSEYESNNDATCETNGTKSRKCKVCTYKSAPIVDTNTPALGHSFTKYISDGNATCTVDGTQTAYCDNGCGMSDTIIEEAVGHDINSYCVEKVATCTEEGLIRYKCFSCDYTYTEIEPKKSHDLWDSKDIQPTCTDDGLVELYCSNCDYTYTETIPATGHNYPDNWSVLVEPDCETKGINVKICLNCNDLITQKLPKAGHADKDGDSKCDTCNKEIIVTEPDEPAEPDTPDEPEVPEEKPCSCDCHAGGIKAFFFKLINFFAKIFDKSARVCECGKSH